MSNLRIFSDYIEDFQNSLEEDMYLNVLSTNFSSKQEKISLETELYNYVLEIMILCMKILMMHMLNV